MVSCRESRDCDYDLQVGGAAADSASSSLAKPVLSAVCDLDLCLHASVLIS